MTEQAPAEKVDPETLVLRAKPRHIVRIKRNLLIAAAFIGCLGLVTLTWLGLTPSLFKASPKSPNSAAPEVRPAGLPDQVTALPKSYADVPQLGEPLPGDLGRPILEHRQAQVNGAAEIAAGTSPVSVPRDVKASPNAGLFFAVTTPASDRIAGILSAPSEANQQLMEANATPPTSAASAKEAFLSTTQHGGAIDPHRMQYPRTGATLMAGTVISAALVTGLNSDIPGIVLAQVTTDVHDLNGRTLIPKGTRLMGKYDSTVSFGQSRALVIWQRLIWPDGRSLEIDNSPASDLEGYAGLSDSVSFHTAAILKGIGMSTLLGLTGMLDNDSDNDLVKALQTSILSTGNQAGQQIVSRQLDVQPTITVRPGWPVRVIVQKDLQIDQSANEADND